MTGPVLVVADNATILGLAPRWAREFAAAGRLHRVRLVGSADDREIEGVVAEARSLEAVAIMAAGDADSQAVAAAAAARLGVPLVRAAADGAG